MLSTATLLALLPLLAAASPLEKRWTSGAAFAGSATSDVFPPTGTQVNSVLFPAETVIGYPGVTATGVEPAAIQTAPAFAYNNEGAKNYPLVTSEPYGDSNDDVQISEYWGNLAPWYSVPSTQYGLPETATPLLPESCSITQVHLLYRHGARYPTTGALPSLFATNLKAAAKTGFVATGDLEFLNDWTYKLGAELLTPFGRLQNFELGVSMRQDYGVLLNNFTEQGALPVFRTESQDRMVKTANNFAAGFFGVPEYLDEASIEIVVEASGFNNTGAPYETCTNSNVPKYGSIGSTAANAFAATAFNSTAQRLQSQITGFNITSSVVLQMLELCAYETDALGSSIFCPLFTKEDFENLEYFFDISFYYTNGMGSPVAAAQGLGYLQEFLARFEQQLPASLYDSTLNSTLDSNPATFPLNQSIYADATHEVVVLDTLTAFNLTNLFCGGPVNPTERSNASAFVASKVVPFGTHLVIQVMECSDMVPTKQMRFIVNDAVVPLTGSYEGCEYNADGLCAFDTVVAALNKRVAEIDYQHACFGNYTVSPGQDYNGLAPKS